MCSSYLYPFHLAVILDKDLVSAHTVFSSILDGSARKALADEMSRILKSTGKIRICDYRISDPRNPDTVGIRKREIQRLFPGLAIQKRSLTLAPPILRRVAPISPLLAHVLESWFPFFRTHAFYLISSRKGAPVPSPGATGQARALR